MIAQKHFKGNSCFWFLDSAERNYEFYSFFLCMLLSWDLLSFPSFRPCSSVCSTPTHQECFWLGQLVTDAVFKQGWLLPRIRPRALESCWLFITVKTWIVGMHSGHLPLGLGLLWGYTPRAQPGGPVDPWPFSWQHQLTVVLLFVMWAPTLQGLGRDWCLLLPAPVPPR